MKLWLLKPAENLTQGDNPWEPWFDKIFGFVIRSDIEGKARQLAHQNAGCENDNEFLGAKVSNTTTPWLDPKYSTCRELNQDGESEVILVDERTA